MTVVSQRGVLGGWVVGIGVRGFRDAHVKERIFSRTITVIEKINL